jgi:hypothetical protein
MTMHTTMSRFAFDLATPADDRQLGEVLAATPMDGQISVVFARHPSYFGAAAVDGRTVQVGVARDNLAGRIVGMGSRAISLRYVNGERIAVGYLSGLRLLREYRGRASLLARGYRFLRELHEDRVVAFYLTTIAADNDAALNVLASGRAGLPVYHPCGSYYTLPLSTSQMATFGASNGAAVAVRQATVADRDAILRFLNEHGPQRAFFPFYEARDLFSGGGSLQGLTWEDVLLAYRDGEIVGTLAGWDQSDFKQIRIHRYRGWLRPARPLYNAWALLRRRATLPAVGATLRVRLAAIPVVRDDDSEVFHRLLSLLLRRMAQRRERLLLVGMHEADPLLPVAQQYAGRAYITRLYIVYWPDEAPDVGDLTRRVPYLELGAL